MISDLGIVDRQIAEVVVLETGAVVYQKLHDVDVTFGRGQM